MTTLGAFRFDGLVATGGAANLCVANLFWLSPAAYHNRAPFYLTIAGTNSLTGRCDTQPIMDAEINYAYRHRIDYWAYDILPDEKDYFASGVGNTDYWIGYNRMFDLHRASSVKSKVKLCINWVGGYMSNSAWWASTLQAWIVAAMQDSAYMKVLTNRPLMYLFGADAFVSHDFSGNSTNARAALDNLRTAVQAVGLGNPYIVGLGAGGAISNFTALGLDAASIYTEFPAALNQTFAAFKAIQDSQGGTLISAHGKYVPAVSFGIDYNPISDANGYVGSYTPPGQGEAIAGSYNAPPADSVMAQWIVDGEAYIAANPTICPADTLICYAWSEQSEAAGTLVPKVLTGSATLSVIAQRLGGIIHDATAGSASGIPVF